jgi:hypothetical protein
VRGPLRGLEHGIVPQHRVHDDAYRRASAIRASRIVERLTMTNAQSFRFNAPQ